MRVARGLWFTWATNGRPNMKIHATLDTTPLQNTINRAMQRGQLSAVELVREAGTFFTRSFVRAMPKSKARRKVYQFEDTSRGKSRLTRVVNIRDVGPVFRRRANDLQPFRNIDYRGVGRLSIVEAARGAGLAASYSGPVGVKAKSQASSLSRGIFSTIRDKPYVEFHYWGRDVAGQPGQIASRKAMSKAARGMNIWIRRMVRESTKDFK